MWVGGTSVAWGYSPHCRARAREGRLLETCLLTLCLSGS